MAKPIMVQMLLDLLEESNKHKSAPDISEMTLYKFLEAKARHEHATMFIASLFYYMNGNSWKYDKAEVLALAAEVPELAQYLRDHNKSYNSEPKFSKDELGKLPTGTAGK